MNENVIEFLKENHQNRAIELEDKFSSVNLVLNDILRDLIKQAQSLQENKDYKRVLNIVEVQKNINEAMTSTESIISKLRVNQKQVIEDDTNNQQDNDKDLSNYDEYLVDTSVPHNLKEDFRFKRPYAFSMKKHYVKVSTWKEMLIATCQYLYKKDPEKFQSFADDKSMQWGKTYNFSRDEKLLRTPVLIEDSGVFIETSKDSIAVRQLIIKMLERFGADIKDFKVFLRADYTKRQKTK